MGGGRVLRPLSPALLLLLCAGCGQQDNDPGPGGVTVGEARELDEAAEMLEQQRRKPNSTPELSGEDDSTAIAPPPAP